MGTDASGSEPRRRRGPSLRPLFSMALALAAVVFLWLYARGDLGGPGRFTLLPSSARDGFVRSQPGFAPLTEADREQLRRQRALVDDLARRHVGLGISGSPDDLRILQEILDRAAPAPDETYTLQALGVVLGDVLATELGLSWAVWEDELGRSRALRLDEDEAVFPVTMISKRVEGGVPFRVEELYRSAAEAVETARARIRAGR